jgi:hypothetical protein
MKREKKKKKKRRSSLPSKQPNTSQEQPEQVVS